MKLTKALPNGNAPIYLRINIDSERVEAPDISYYVARDLDIYKVQWLKKPHLN